MAPNTISRRFSRLGGGGASIEPVNVRAMIRPKMIPGDPLDGLEDLPVGDAGRGHRMRLRGAADYQPAQALASPAAASVLTRGRRSAAPARRRRPSRTTTDEPTVNVTTAGLLPSSSVPGAGPGIPPPGPAWLVLIVVRLVEPGARAVRAWAPEFHRSPMRRSAVCRDFPAMATPDTPHHDPRRRHTVYRLPTSRACCGRPTSTGRRRQIAREIATARAFRSARCSSSCSIDLEGWGFRGDQWSDLTFYWRTATRSRASPSSRDERWRSEMLMFAAAELRKCAGQRVLRRAGMIAEAASACR